MKTFKSFLLLTLVFVTGIIVGVVTTRIVVRRMVEQAILQPDKVETLAELRLTRKLHLDPAQQAKLHKIFQTMRDQLKNLHREYQPQGLKILSKANDDITAMLTPEQQVLYDKWKEDDHPLLKALKQGQ